MAAAAAAAVLPFRQFRNMGGDVDDDDGVTVPAAATAAVIR